MMGLTIHYQYLIGLVLLGLVGCYSPSRFLATDISGANIGNTEWTLTDHEGQPRRLSDFNGKVVVLFFGYSQCPDVCPFTLAKLATAMQLLKKQAEQVQVLLISIDPQRDSLAQLGVYVTSFYPTFLGLTGSELQLKTIAEQFKLFYRNTSKTGTESYTLEHSSGSYIFDRHGKLRLFVNGTSEAEVFAHDIALLLR